jgi:hypothetical protein
MSSALWWVTKGRAAAPPGTGCRTGVSTSTKARASRNRRMALMAAKRISKTRRASSLTMRST